MIEAIAKEITSATQNDGGKFAESPKEDSSAERDFAESLKEDNSAEKDFAESLKEDNSAEKDFAESLKEDNGAERDFAESLKEDNSAEKDFAESLKENNGDKEQGLNQRIAETVTDNNESEKQEKINPEDYLTKEQMDTLKQKYKELGYSDEETEAKIQEYAQKARACKEAEENGLNNLDNKQKGNYGEMKTDLDMLDRGYVRISKEGVTSLDDKGHQGIDGVYENPDGVPKYLIEDSKYGSSQLSDTKDGKQMSDEWVDKRLDEAVGKEKADEIRMEQIENPDNVGKEVAHIDSEGNVTYTDIDNSEEGDNKDV